MCLSISFAIVTSTLLGLFAHQPMAYKRGILLHSIKGLIIVKTKHNPAISRSGLEVLSFEDLG